jgi:hypothetical protein
MGARIETPIIRGNSVHRPVARRTEAADRNGYQDRYDEYRRQGRSPRGSVDRNEEHGIVMTLMSGRTARGAWIETVLRIGTTNTVGVAPCVGARIETIKTTT